MMSAVSKLTVLITMKDVIVILAILILCLIFYLIELKSKVDYDTFNKDL